MTILGVILTEMTLWASYIRYMTVSSGLQAAIWPENAKPFIQKFPKVFLRMFNEKVRPLSKLLGTKTHTFMKTT